MPKQKRKDDKAPFWREGALQFLLHLFFLAILKSNHLKKVQTQHDH
jgi:hypothetical protein